ncbi:hypothetical protein [Streptomyces sp. KL116D]|uniref:hypothetical protein n=1 Tax=Streptomyces sp. KL116D TaxID=3045152 RepID=UPI0035570735
MLAVSDWMRQVPDQISQWIEQDYYSLGTDGFGLSDTRRTSAATSVDAESIVVTALARLARAEQVSPGDRRPGPRAVRPRPLKNARRRVRPAPYDTDHERQIRRAVASRPPVLRS